jgi:hypothetical protein
MAIVENPEMGRVRRSVGNVVFSTCGGQNVIRTKSITYKDPKTPVQLFYRDRWRKLLKLLSQVNTHLKNAYNGSEERMTTFAYVTGLNMNKCFVDNSTLYDPTLLKLCDHDGSFVDNVILTSTVANIINGKFKSKAQNVDEGADPVKAYGFYPDGNKIWQFDQVAVRSTRKITLTRPGISGLNIAVYFECLDRVNLLNGEPRHVIKYVGTVMVL